MSIKEIAPHITENLTVARFGVEVMCEVRKRRRLEMWRAAVFWQKEFTERAEHVTFAVALCCMDEQRIHSVCGYKNGRFRAWVKVTLT